MTFIKVSDEFGNYTIKIPSPDKNIKILQITAIPLPEGLSEFALVYGLGDDGKVYIWDTKKIAWVLNT